MRKVMVYLLLSVLLIGLIGAQEQGNSNETEIPDSETEEEEDLNESESQNATNITEKRKITFVPWQKKNESECQEGCKCRGAVISCPTETGKIMNITAGASGNIIIITIDKINVSTELELEQERIQNRTRLKAKLKNGTIAEIKIMPDVASERALERLRLKVCTEENNCSIELKEVGKSDEDRQLAYELQIQRHSRILGIFQKKMRVLAQINAENGEVIRVRKPWWAFLASEPAEE